MFLQVDGAKSNFFHGMNFNQRRKDGASSSGFHKFDGLSIWATRGWGPAWPRLRGTTGVHISIDAAALLFHTGCPLLSLSWYWDHVTRSRSNNTSFFLQILYFCVCTAIQPRVKHGGRGVQHNRVLAGRRLTAHADPRFRPAGTLRNDRAQQIWSFPQV